MKIIPHPDHWLSYKPRPDMQGKRLGVFAHVWVKNGAQGTIKDIYKNIVDIAIEEETCIILSSAQSLIDTRHNMLYEEWSDYEDFFKVQMRRTYRHAFNRWIDPVKIKPVSPEFTEILYSSGEHPKNIANNAFSLVQSAHIAAGREDDARNLFAHYIKDLTIDANNLYANLHQSLNNPQHFLLYEVWSDLGHLIKTDLKSDRRHNLEESINNLKDATNHEPTTEIFQIYYDPEKYSEQS